MFTIKESEVTTKKAITVDGETFKDSQYTKGLEVEKEHKDVYDFFKDFLKKNNLEMPISEEDFYGKITVAHLRENPEDYYPEEPEPYKLVPAKEKTMEKEAALSTEDTQKLEHLQKQLETQDLTQEEMDEIEMEIDKIVKKEAIYGETDPFNPEEEAKLADTEMVDEIINRLANEGFNEEQIIRLLQKYAPQEILGMSDIEIKNNLESFNKFMQEEEDKGVPLDY